MKRKIGITSTIPIEIVLAAGDVPVDLNNLFINDLDPARFIRYAEDAGYPANICCWVKGLFGLVMETRCVDVVVALTQGDCSSTLALIETLMIRDVPVIPFGYPFSRDRDLLRLQIEKLATALGTTLEAGEEWLERLRPTRNNLAELDRLTWREGIVSGAENHRFLVSASDLGSDPEAFGEEVDAFLKNARTREPFSGDVRLGYIGVPPIWADLHEYLESQGACVVFNETQRQFSMCWAGGDIVDQYASYTYPYGVFARLEDIETAVAERGIEGIVHYAQSFCFRQIEDMIFREKLSVPILTIDGDQPASLDGRTKIRICAYIEMLRKKHGRSTRDSQAEKTGMSADCGKDL